MSEKQYAKGSTSRPADSSKETSVSQKVEDRVIKEPRPDTAIRSSQSPDPKGSSRMKLRSGNPDPENVMYYI